MEQSLVACHAREMMRCASTVQLARLKATVLTSPRRLYLLFRSSRPTILLNIYKLRVNPAFNHTGVAHILLSQHQNRLTRAPQSIPLSSATSRFGGASQDIVGTRGSAAMVTATFDRLIGDPFMSLIRSIFRKTRRTKAASPSSSSSRSTSSLHSEIVNKPPSSLSSLADSITRFPRTPTKFKRFRLLPPEIRAQIWAYAMRHPLPTEGYNSSLGPHRNNYRPLASNCIKWPPMLVVCRESRYEAIRYYESKLGPLKQFKNFGNPENESRTVKGPETKGELKLIR